MSYTGNANPEVCKAAGLPEGWHVISFMAHAGVWTQWTYFDGSSNVHIRPGAAIIYGTWLTGQYMAGWGLIVQIPSCYQLSNLFVKNGSVFVSGIGWKTLPAPSINLSYQAYIIGYNVFGMGLTDGMAYVVTFDAQSV